LAALGRFVCGDRHDGKSTRPTIAAAIIKAAERDTAQVMTGVTNRMSFSIEHSRESRRAGPQTLIAPLQNG
jgi:hypothetical protein